MLAWSDEAFAGYLAAMIDGEGHIERIGNYSVRVRIANTVRPTLQAIIDRLGFGRVIEYARPSGSTYKRLFCAEFSSCRDVRRIWELCGRYIHMKPEQRDESQQIICRAFQRVQDRDNRNIQIVEMLRSGMRQTAIARHFGVSPQLISRVKKGHTWPSVLNAHRMKQGIKNFPTGADQSIRLAALQQEN